MGRLINSSCLIFDELCETEVSVRDAYGSFKDQMIGRGCSPSTIRAYDNHVPEFIDYLDSTFSGGQTWRKGSFPCSKVSNDHIIQWQGVLRLQRGNKDTSIRTKVKSIRTFLYWCMDEDRAYCTRFKIKLPKAIEELKEPYTKQEIELLMARPRTNDLSEWKTWAAICLMLRTGMRRSSICELKWCDIDCEKRFY